MGGRSNQFSIVLTKGKQKNLTIYKVFNECQFYSPKQKVVREAFYMHIWKILHSFFVFVYLEDTHF